MSETATVEPVKSRIRITQHPSHQHRTMRFLCPCGVEYPFYPPANMTGPKCSNCNRELGEYFLDAIAEYVKKAD